MLELRDRKFEVALGRLTPTLHKTFTNVIRRYAGDKAKSVKDLIQETIEQAYRNSRLPQYADYTEERLLLEKMANVVSDYVQSSRISTTVPLTKISEKPCEPVLSFTTKELLDYLYKHTDPPTPQICTLILEGWTYKAIGEVLGISESAVKMRVYRLKAKLRSSR